VLRAWLLLLCSYVYKVLLRSHYILLRRCSVFQKCLFPSWLVVGRERPSPYWVSRNMHAGGRYGGAVDAAVWRLFRVDIARPRLLATLNALRTPALPRAGLLFLCVTILRAAVWALRSTALVCSLPRCHAGCGVRALPCVRGRPSLLRPGCASDLHIRSYARCGLL